MGNTIKVNMGRYFVELPTTTITMMDVVHCFADAYVKHTASTGIVSDDVMFSSIGADRCRSIMLRFVMDVMPEADKEVAKRVVTDDANWEVAVLTARYGKRQAYIKRHGQSYADMLEREYPGFFN